MTSRIKNISLSTALWREEKGSYSTAAPVKGSSMANKRRIIKRLHLVTKCIVVVRIVFLFAIAAIATSALVNIFFKQL